MKKFKKIYSGTKRKCAKLSLSAYIMFLSLVGMVSPAFANNTGIEGGGTAATVQQNADQTFNDVIEFAATWIGRLGLVIGFVGTVMFFLAMKDDSADGKQKGLMTLIAGFGVFAVTGSLDLFGIV